MKVEDQAAELYPEDLDAERSLIATCCAAGAERLAAQIAADLAPDAFSHPGHQAVWAALQEILGEDGEVTAVTLRDCLQRRGTLPRIGDFTGLVQILASEEVVRPKILADILRRKKKQRDLLKVGARITRLAGDPETDPDALITEAAAELMRLAGVGVGTELRPFGEVVEESLQDVLRQIDGEQSTGIKVGMPRLDAMTHGFQPGNVVMLAARPGVGKTALALNWAIYTALRLNHRVAFFSLEMSAAEVGSRALSIVSSVGMKQLVQSGGDPALLAKVFAARDDLRSGPIWVCDQANITVPQMHAMCTKAASRPGEAFDMVVIDYLQLLASPDNSRAAKQNEAVRVGEISRSLKLMAKDLGVPVVVLSQLNREVEKRAGGRPQLSDLRDSGALEQDADIVAMIHRKMLPVAEGETPDPLAELILAKHRNGPTGLIPLHFEAATNRYREFERLTQEI